MYLKDPQWNRSARRCFEIRAEVWPDTRRCNQCRMSMKKLRGERQSRCTTTGATSPKRVSFAQSVAVISPVVHTRERDRVTTTCKATYFAAHPGGNVSRILSCRSYRRAGPEVVGMDNLKNSEYPPMGWRGRLDERKEGRKKEEEEKRRERCSDSSVRDSCCGCEEVQDGGHLSSPKSQMVGMYELMAELIFSALRPIN
ncbi:hypothetical protein Acr_00g0058120 [Actinidia rufa]|uniref:Uncharacterized protein n=1 Tax=Actinidia rufa TaxID=165716 RepID=A0A7J0DP91_9ERIC|nr:hypothetical protein Acr_00g0058120 [Actinidia rufa]